MTKKTPGELFVEMISGGKIDVEKKNEFEKASNEFFAAQGVKTNVQIVFHEETPHRKLTDEEIWEMRDKMLEIVSSYVGCSEELCSVGDNGKYPACDTCWKYHMKLGTDPWCVEHG